MKVGGRIIQKRFINEFSENNIDLIYKGYRILIEAGGYLGEAVPPHWCEVFGNKNGEYIFKGVVRRCKIRDVLVAVLNECKL